MWRKTNGSLLIQPAPLYSGNKSLFYFNYSQVLGDLPISGAAPYITLYNNVTDEPDKIWGEDWPPNLPLIESVMENLSALGYYNLTCKTLGVPPSNYSVYLNISKPFFDPIILDSYINITGLPLNIIVSYGATNQSGQLFINSNNIPYVNDTSSSWIVVKITDDSEQVVSGGLISGRFNGSSNVFYGYDIYSKTLDEDYKGFYNISLNTMGLNATTSPNSGFNNYSLFITVTVNAYSPSTVNISTPIKPLPTMISSSNIPNLYEAGSFEIYSTFQNMLNPAQPLPLNGGTLGWVLSANSTVFAFGNFTFVLSGVYKAVINLETASYYINPGIYNFSINGTQRNCAYSEFIQNNITIYSKKATQIALSINPTVRIGQTLNVIANLSYINGTPIAFEDVEIRITYKETDSFNVIQTTDSQGIATYSQIVPYSYAYYDVMVNVTFNGNSTVDMCTNGIVKDIKGLYKVNLTLNEMSEIRVGYNSTLNGTIIIEDQQSYSGFFLTIAAWYDNVITSRIFISDVRCDESGLIRYQIPIIEDGHQNITFFMDYSGSSTIEYAQVNFTIDILPKWEIDLQLINLSSIVRIGYDFKIQINGSFLEETLNKSFFYGLPLYLDIKFSTGSILSMESFFDISGFVVFSFIIPEYAGESMNITLRFLGTTQISNFTHTYSYPILPKWELTLSMDELPEIIRQGQTLNFIIRGTFNEENCPESYLGLPITIRLNYGNDLIPLEITGTLSQEGIFSYSHQIPIITISSLDLTFGCVGNSKIANVSFNLTSAILPQKQTLLTILSASNVEEFSGSYSFSVKITDEDSIALESQEVYFIVRDLEENVIGNYTAISNEEGIASTLIEFENTGEYTIDAVYFSAGIYQSAKLSSNDTYFEVRIIDYGILFVDNLPLILLILGIAIGMGLVYNYAVARPRQIRKQNALKEIHRRFADVENVQYILIIHKDAGVPVFSRAFTEIPIDETLVSGFLSAINSFGAEIGAKVGGMNAPGNNIAAVNGMGSGLEELAYGMFKIAVFEGQFVRTAILLLKTASPSLKTLMKQFNAEFEKEFGSVVESFTGQIPDPEPIMELVERILHADLLYMHNVVLNKVPAYMKQIGKNTLKGMILTEANTPNFNNMFKVREMINTMAGYGKSDVATFNAIDDLRRAGVVFAVNSRTKDLMEKFKPFITPLSPNARKFLKLSADGIIDENELKKQLNIKDLAPIIAELNVLELIGQNKLTETGTVIATLLNLMPDM